MPDEFKDLVVDKSVVTGKSERLLSDWRWLCPDGGQVILATACGDLFLEQPNGNIEFLDTYAGTRKVLASTFEVWKEQLQQKALVADWFRCALLDDIQDAGLSRKAEQCFSPLHLPLIGGSWTPSNFQACSLIVHLVVGQIHQQVKDLPPGTKITGIDVEWT